MRALLHLNIGPVELKDGQLDGYLRATALCTRHLSVPPSSQRYASTQHGPIQSVGPANAVTRTVTNGMQFAMVCDLVSVASAFTAALPSVNENRSMDTVLMDNLDSWLCRA